MHSRALAFHAWPAVLYVSGIVEVVALAAIGLFARLSRAQEEAVADNGTGMSPDQIRRCFDPYYTTRSDSDGMGVGLALCKAIAERSGSVLTVDSTPGIGTTVRFLLHSRPA